MSMLVFGAFEHVGFNHFDPLVNVLVVVGAKNTEDATILIEFIHGVRKYLTFFENHFFDGNQITI